MNHPGASGRVLWVTAEPPDRSLGGGSIRQAHLFAALASAVPTDLLLVGSLADDQIRQAAASVTELPRRDAPWTEHPLGRRALELAIGLGSRYPFSAYPSTPWRRALARALSQRDGYSLICVEHEALAPLPAPSGGPPARRLVTFHHVFSEMVEQELARAAGGRQRWFLRRDLEKARRLERRAIRSYDRVVVCSEEDEASLARLHGEPPAGRLAVVPNGVDLAGLPATALPTTPGVLFPGSFAYGPNVDGALWFCAEVWPRVRGVLPEATLVLAGRDPVAQIVALARLPGVSVHPNVPSMAEYFAAARAVVVPLRVGTGTRLKALEAMAAARPVVGTSLGLQGIGVVDGVEVRIADDAERFAAALIETLRNDERARELAAAGRRHVESRFGWDRIGSEFVAMVSELLADGRVY